MYVSVYCCKAPAASAATAQTGVQRQMGCIAFNVPCNRDFCFEEQLYDSNGLYWDGPSHWPPRWAARTWEDSHVHHLSFIGMPLAMHIPADDMLVQRLVAEVSVFRQNILGRLQ